MKRLFGRIYSVSFFFFNVLVCLCFAVDGRLSSVIQKMYFILVTLLCDNFIQMR